MIELKHIHKYYNAGSVSEMCLFDDFNLTIQDGEFVSIVGSNGSGKTSLLNIICGSGADPDWGQGYYKAERLSAPSQYRACLSGSFQGYLRAYDYLGKHGTCGQ